MHSGDTTKCQRTEAGTGCQCKTFMQHVSMHLRMQGSPVNQRACWKQSQVPRYCGRRRLSTCRRLFTTSVCRPSPLSMLRLIFHGYMAKSLSAALFWVEHAAHILTPTPLGLRPPRPAGRHV